MGRFLPQDLRKALYAEALRLASEGLGYRRIARELRERFGASVSMSTISYWVRGLSTPYYRRFPSEERLEIYREALRLYAEGYGCKEIAEMLSISPSTVRDWVAGKYSPLGSKRPGRRRRTRKISLKPSPELAYVIGVVLGDGYAINTRKHEKSSD